jgi:hypothetical protein
MYMPICNNSLTLRSTRPPIASHSWHQRLVSLCANTTAVTHNFAIHNVQLLADRNASAAVAVHGTHVQCAVACCGLFIACYNGAQVATLTLLCALYTRDAVLSFVNTIQIT